MKRKLVWLLTLLMVMQVNALTVSAATTQAEDVQVSGINSGNSATGTDQEAGEPDAEPDDDENEEEHIHSYKWFVTKKATTTKNGSKICVCSECGNIAKTATIKATGKYKIRYRLNGGKNSSKNPVAYNKSTKTIKLQKPTRTGYTFKGWYKNEKMTKSIKNIKKGSKGNITLFAKWSKKKYNISYVLNSGKNSSKNPKSYTIRTKTFSLKNPTRAGYTFDGWYKDKKFTKKVTGIKKGSTGNVTLYAKWSKKKYNISYALNGGVQNDANPTSYTITSTVALKNPTKTDRTFAGWYSDKKLTKKVTEIKKGTTGNITLYAKWIAKQYKISYVLNGGKNNSKNPKTYSEEIAVSFKTPTRTNYAFKGWYSDKNMTKKVTGIKKGTTGTITVYAKWEKVQTSYKNRDAASKERFKECTDILKAGRSNTKQFESTFIDYFHSICISRSTTDGSWMYMYISNWDDMSDHEGTHIDLCFEELPSLTKKCLMAIAPVGGEELYYKVNKLIKKYGSPYKVPDQGTIKENIPGLRVTIMQGKSGIEIEFWAEK